MGARYGLTYNAGLSDLAFKLRNTKYIWDPSEMFESLEGMSASQAAAWALTQVNNMTLTPTPGGAWASWGSSPIPINKLPDNNWLYNFLIGYYTDIGQGRTLSSGTYAGNASPISTVYSEILGTPGTFSPAILPPGSYTAQSGFQKTVNTVTNDINTTLKDVGSIAGTAAGLANSLTGGGAPPPQPPPQPPPIAGPGPGLIIGFFIAAAGLVLVIIAATEGKE